MKRPSHKALVRQAQRQYHDEGTIEIDDGAKVSTSDDPDTDGAYVQAWVWVRYDDCQEKP